MKIFVLLIAVALLLDSAESLFGVTKPNCNKCKKNSDCGKNKKCIKITFCKYCIKLPTFTKPPPTTKKTTTTTTTTPTTPTTVSTTPTTPSTTPTTASTPKPAPTTCEPPKTSDTTSVRCYTGRDKGDTCIARCKAGYCSGLGLSPFTTCKCKDGKCYWDKDLSGYCSRKVVDQCKTDIDCTDPKKPSCRPGICGKTCMQQLTIPSPAPCESQCEVNGDCEEGSSCIENRFMKCKTCVKVPTRPSICNKPCQSSIDCSLGEICGFSPSCLTAKQCQIEGLGFPSRPFLAPYCPIGGPDYVPPKHPRCPKIPCVDDKGCETTEVCCNSLECRSTVCKSKANTCAATAQNPCTTDKDCKANVEKCMEDGKGCKMCWTGKQCPGKIGSCSDDKDCTKDQQCVLDADGCKICKSMTTLLPPNKACTKIVRQCSGDWHCQRGTKCLYGSDGCKTCREVGL